MEHQYETPNNKKRHGCVTAWLILMILVNSLGALANLFAGEVISRSISGNISDLEIVLLGILGVANVFFSILLLQWKRIGFWGFILTAITAFGINMSVGMEIFQSISGLIGIVILLAILQIKRNNVSAWNNLE